MSIWTVLAVASLILVMSWLSWVQVMNGHLVKQRALGLFVAVLIIPAAAGLAWLLT